MVGRGGKGERGRILRQRVKLAAYNGAVCVPLMSECIQRGSIHQWPAFWI